MEQYIEKSAVVAEIERRLWLLVPKMTFHQQREELEKLLSFLNTLEVKEVEEIAEDVKDATMRDLAWKVHVMICEGKSISEIDHYVCGVCDF